MKSKTNLVITAAIAAAYVSGMYFPAWKIKSAEDQPFLAHKPPDKSLIGQMEGSDGPFKVENSILGDKVIMEDHKWEVDCKDGKPVYLASANGTTRVEFDDGTFQDVPLTVIEDYDYDPAKSTKAPKKRLPIADADKLPDSLYYSSLKVYGIFGAAVWERIRTAALPYTFEANGQEYTVRRREVPVSANISRQVTIAAGVMRAAGSKLAPKPFTYQEERIITQ